jgi:hypothetical protein
VSTLDSYRPNFEVDDLEPLTSHLRDVFGFAVEVHEEAMGLVLLQRDGLGVAVVRTGRPGANETTAGYVGVTGVDALHDECLARGADIAVPLTDHAWGLRDFVAALPGGHRLAFGERK